MSPRTGMARIVVTLTPAVVRARRGSRFPALRRPSVIETAGNESTLVAPSLPRHWRLRARILISSVSTIASSPAPAAIALAAAVTARRKTASARRRAVQHPPSTTISILRERGGRRGARGARRLRVIIVIFSLADASDEAGSGAHGFVSRVRIVWSTDLS